MKIHIVGISLAALLVAGAAHSAAFAQNAARLQTSMTSSDVKVFNECLAMTDQEMHARIACVDILQKAKLTPADMALIRVCKSQPKDTAMRDKACVGMNDDHPEIRLLAK